MIVLPTPPALLPNALPFAVDGQANIPGAASTAWVTLASYQAVGYRSYVTAYGVTVRDTTYDFSGSLGFRITIDEGPIQDGTPQGFWTTQRGSVQTPIPALIFVNNQSILRLQVRRLVTAGAAQIVAFLATGFRYPPEVRKDATHAEAFMPTYRPSFNA